ncbi:MAG: hypothetical protein E6623_12245 [Clostridium perfringens]|uniref:RelA/SpoT domain-containing protein n=1 Tax=Clostridium perfringens TaxID=1502 RepID=A0A133MIZ5_CLOPF|nr:hypothetical protein [Clostridium perfringens]KXA04046.1 hypothetical protein HMPREF3222_03221 [Clostridium perfringens]MBS5921607.1 hypothetical protein [Clostridium perfringens]MCX0388294.1 hypothetical protein [Clostridium perfringens]MDK0570849.1 hypothetical protein [Clostridium perfringens]MDK0709430.1 hypothetical protein [Clostridium perfringens]
MDINKLVRSLDSVSYETKLGKNLKNTLRKFDRNELMEELKDYRLFLKKRKDILIDYTYRIKSIQSINLKYDRYYPSKEINACFNDILGIRMIVDNYDINIKNDKIRHVDMSKGKKNDDGYRGYHIYYKKSNYHYPIEVQFFTERDYIFNMWLHKYVYKYKDNSIGIKLRELYDKNIIMTEEDFKEEFNKCIIY